MESKENYLKTGTTTVGILCKDAVILAADRRATAGSLIADKNIEKVLPVNEGMAVTTAGSVSDIQLLVRYLKAEIKLKDLRTGRKSTAREVANMLGSMTYSQIRRMGGVCHFIFGAYDTLGIHLYDIYPDGSTMEVTEQDGFVASGSGSVMAYGVLEDSWKKGLTEEQGIDMALRAINAAIQRDTGSGQGADVFVIDKKGVRKAAQKLLNTKLQ